MQFGEVTCSLNIVRRLCNMHLNQSDLCEPGRMLNSTPQINKVGQLNLGGFISIVVLE